MATWSGDQTASKGLGEEDLGTLCNALYPVCKKYKFLGLQIGVKKSEIETIEAQHNDPGERLLEVLSLRLKKTKTITWNDIDTALRSGCMGEDKVADGIQENYSHLFSFGQEHDTKRRKKKEKRGKYYADRHRESSSDRQEEDSDGEVSGRAEALRTKPKKYPETHLSSSEKESKVKKVRETVEKCSARHKQGEIPEEGKGKNKNEKSTKVTSAQSERREKVQKERKGKREKESSIRDDFSDTEGDDAQSDNENEMMTKESDNETSASSSGEEAVNFPFQSEVREKADKSKVSAREKKSELVEQKRMKEKQKEKEKQRRAGDERGQYSDGEVHESPHHNLKISKRVESEGGKESKEAQKGKKKAMKMAQSVKESLSLSSTKEQQKGKRNVPLDEAASTREKYLKTHSKQSTKPPESRETGISLTGKTKKTAALPLEDDTPGSGSAQDDSECEESDADGSSEGEEDKDSEQKSSNEEEEEEIEHDDESSVAATTSEEEVQTRTNEKSLKSEFTSSNEKRSKRAKETGKRKEAKVVAAVDIPDIPRESIPGRDREEHDVQPKKKGRRRLRESGTSPIPKGSSSPSTSQEEKQQESDPRGQRRKKERGTGYKKEKKEKKQGETDKPPSSSETDDSSPECDMAQKLSKADGKKLRKTFRQFFGRLCCKITDPVQIAAELQNKGVISISVMKDMIMSPETQQAKTINLVGALDKKIKSQPDRLFLFIEALLESSTPQLQEAGREMSRKAGEVCPGREVAKFPTPFQTGTSSFDTTGNKGETLPNKAEYVNSGNTLSIGGETTVLSLEVSQSAPQLNPVLAIYKEYLKSYYNARVLAPADKYLPTLSVPYISLAMVGRGFCGPEQRDEFTRQTLHGGVDQILQSKKPISIRDLLTPEDSGAPVRFILVEGPPGIGKSTFAWEACRKWDEIESLRGYHTVVLLKLREKWVLDATSPSDLFRYPPDPEFRKSIAKALNSSHGRNLLLILDGFDEVSHSFHENSVIKSILCRQLLPECTIILTTRPSAKHTLRSVCQPRVDKHVEIIGFTEVERVKYITEVFRKEPELQVNFLKYMFLVPHIKSMMYIPLNCAIIAQVYYESQSSRHLAIPRTRTQLYKVLTHSLLLRHMKTKDSNYEYSSMLPEGLDGTHMDRFKILAKFAFDSYHKRGSRKVTFFKEDVPEGLVHFGFMNESTEMYASKGVGRTLSFLHLSLQEYLAAWHLTNNYSIEFQVAYHWLSVSTVAPRRPHSPPSQDPPPPSFYKHHEEETPSLPPSPHPPLTHKVQKEEEKALISSLEHQQLSLVEPAIFLAGITGWRCQSEDDRNHWEMYLSRDTADFNYPELLLPSLYEAQNPNILSHYFAGEARRRSRISVGRDEDVSKPYDSYALSYCLALSSYPLSLLVLDIRYESDISLVEVFVKGLDDHCKTTTPNVTQLEVELSRENANECLSWLIKSKLVKLKRVRNIFKYISSTHVDYLQSLVGVEILKVHSDSIQSWKWLSALQSLSNLKILHISSGTTYRTTDFHWDRAFITPSVGQVKYALTRNRHSSTVMLQLGQLVAVLKMNPITEMMLCNVVCRETMAGVRSILQHCPSLTTLELKRTRLGYDGILYLCSALRTNKVLRNLIIDDVESLPSRKRLLGVGTINPVFFSSMGRVPLPGKTTCTDFLLELNDILKDNTTLEEMKIQSGLFLPLSAGENGEYCQWTGLGPLQQFNVGAVASGMSPNLRRSFSSPDLTQPQTQLLWDRKFRNYGMRVEIDFKQLFFFKKKARVKLFSLPSFTAPDTEVLQSFSGLDPRLKECLEMDNPHQHNVKRLRDTCWGIMRKLLNYLTQTTASID